MNSFSLLFISVIFNLKLFANSELTKNERSIDNMNEITTNKDTKEKTNLYTRIQELEARLEELEYRVPKKYADVKFLTYKDRKRILVNFKLFVSRV